MADAVTGSGAEAPEVWQLFIGQGLGVGLPPLWLSAVVFGVLWLVALLGLARQPRRRTILAAWIVALLALAMAVVLSRLVVSVPPTGTEVRPWVAGYLLIAFAALALAGGTGLEALASELSARSFTWMQPASVLAWVGVAVVTLAAAGWWVWAGARGPIDRVHLDAIPPYVLNAAASDARTRVLAIDLSAGQARYSVVADDQVRLGDADRGGTFGGSLAARQQTEDLVTRLVAGTADADLAPQLADLGIGYVWVTGANEEAQARIDNTPGLGAASGNERSIIWQLEPAVTRAAVVDSAGRAPVTSDTVPAGEPGRQLRIGEAADPRWQATLDGERLTGQAAGWQQAFALPGHRWNRQLDVASAVAMAAGGTTRRAAGCGRAGGTGHPASRCARPDQVGAPGGHRNGSLGMSERDLTLRLGRRTLGRRAVSLLGVTAALVLIGGGGSLLGAESATTASNRVALPGRTTNVCTVSKDEDSRSTVAAVAVRREPDRPGELRVEPLSGGKAELQITDQGKGKSLAQPDGSVLVSAAGMMATGASAAVLETATTGEQAGLMAAPCSPPTTLHWFPGVGSSDTNKTELILTNPDDSQAVVDLRFFGSRGRVAVPGSPNIAVAGRSTRTISIGTLVRTDGPLSVAVRTSSGRIAARCSRVAAFQAVAGRR